MKRALAVAALCVLLAAVSGCFHVDPEIPDEPEEPVIENNLPVAYSPLFSGLCNRYGAKVDADVRYRTQGCDNGAAVYVSGARDPDGFYLEYKFECEYSVFAVVQTVAGTASDTGSSAIRINGEWVAFPVDDKREQNAQVTLFLGMSDSNPPYPYAPPQSASVGTAGCTPSPTPDPDPVEPGVIQFTYTVRDVLGGEASHTTYLPDVVSTCGGG